MTGVEAWRQILTPTGLAVDAKVSGPNLLSAGAAVRRVDAAMEAATAGKHERSVLVNMMTRAVYRARYGDGWPDRLPR